MEAVQPTSRPHYHPWIEALDGGSGVRRRGAVPRPHGRLARGRRRAEQPATRHLRHAPGPPRRLPPLPPLGGHRSRRPRRRGRDDRAVQRRGRRADLRGGARRARGCRPRLRRAGARGDGQRPVGRTVRPALATGHAGDDAAGRLRARACPGGGARCRLEPRRRDRRCRPPALVAAGVRSRGPPAPRGRSPADRPHARPPTPSRLGRIRRLLAVGGRRPCGLALRLHDDRRRRTDRARVHAAGASRQRLRHEPRRRADRVAAGSGRRTVLPLHRPREPDLERDLRCGSATS